MNSEKIKERNKKRWHERSKTEKQDADREYYLKNKDKIKLQSTERWKKLTSQGLCPNCMKPVEDGEIYCTTHLAIIQIRNWKRRGINISPEEYNAMMILQDGLCAVCKNKPIAMRLAVDHDHDTGKIRGLLCRSCNQLVGKIEHNYHLTKRILAYLGEDIS